MATKEPKYGHLVIISRSGSDGKAFPIHYPKVLIGRKETCDIRMQKPQVSKEHCLIYIHNNQPIVRNLSENCTLVNARILGINQQQALVSGDIITIVGRSLRYEQPRRLSGKLELKDTLLFDNRPTHMLVNSRSLGHMEGETEQRLRNWERHYSGDSEDPFAPTGEEAGEETIRRMKRSVQRGLSHISSTEEFFSSLPRAPKLKTNGNASPLKRTISTGGLRRKKALVQAAPIEPDQDQDHSETIRQINSAMRKSVRFGPELSPEVFDSQAPPATPPVKRGTPVRLARRASSILRNATPIRLFENRKYRTTPYPVRKPAERISEIESPTKTAKKKMKLSPMKIEYKEIDETDTRQIEPVMVVCTPKQNEHRIRMRRRTAPANLFKESVEESMKEMARALGEDLPALFDKPKMMKKEEAENTSPVGLSGPANTKQPSDASLVSAQLSELRVSPKKSRGGPRRRQTVLGVFEPSKSLLSFEEENGDDQLEEQRKRRLVASQERRRRMVADLKERRSSWRHMPGTLGPLIKEEHVPSISTQQQSSVDGKHLGSANINMYPPKDKLKDAQNGTGGYPPPKQDIGEGWVEIDNSGKEVEDGSQQIELHAAAGPVEEKKDIPPPNRELQSLLQSQERIEKQSVLVGGHSLRNKSPIKKTKPNRQSITPSRRKRRLSGENGTATRSSKRNKKD